METITNKKEVYEWLKKNDPKLLRMLIKEKENGDPVGKVEIETDIKTK